MMKNEKLRMETNGFPIFPIQSNKSEGFEPKIFIFHYSSAACGDFIIHLQFLNVPFLEHSRGLDGVGAAQDGLDALA